MIRIVHIISSLDTGGAEVMLAKLVSGMDRAQFSNTIISLTDRGQLGEQIERSGVVVHMLGMKRGKPDISALPRLIRLLKALNPAIVQSWLYHADLLSTVAVRLSGSPTLIWNVRCSDMDLTRYPPLTRWVQRALAWLSRTPAAVIVNSEAGKRQHEQLGYRPRRWVVLSNGFDIQKFRPDSSTRKTLRTEWQIPDDRVVVALIARVDPMKDHSTFLGAAKKVAQSGRAAHFVLVGKDTEALAPAVAAMGLEGCTLLMGYQDKVERILSGVDILCLSSIAEGFPNVLGEAMACGIPCVSTDVGDARRIIGDTGLIVPACDPASLACALNDLIDRGPAAREQLGRAARARIEAEYSLARIVDRYSALYADLNANHPLAR